jgi:uncharacterized lipoprotein YddW (UPF0748 family)
MTSRLSILFFFVGLSLVAQTPKRELRGVWIATVQNIDWPSPRNYNAIKQQEEFLDIVNSHQKTGINALFVQVRTAADALYAKSDEPWSAYLSGLQGQSPKPFYDPLAFMIQESHARGIEFHAWLNMNRASMSTKNLLAANHIIRQHPEWMVIYNNQHLFNFGIPSVRHYITQVVKNMVQNYEVDGIHFDDYFYPYPINGAHFNDDETYIQYKLPNESLADWRRRNINLLIEEISTTIKEVNPRVKFGISPFGIWRHKSSDPEYGSPTSKGLQSYDDLFADTENWTKAGWVDYLAPQLYWGTTHRVANFVPLSKWWNEHGYGRPIYVGHAAYHLTDQWNATELSKQLTQARGLDQVKGSIFFSSNQLTNNAKGWRDTLRTTHFKHMALVPTMPWIDNIPPTAPHKVSIQKISGNWTIQWQAGEPSLDKDPPAYYVVYRIHRGVGISEIENSANMIYKGQKNEYIIDNAEMQPGHGFVVTAFDRLHNESPAGTIQWIVQNSN